MKRDVVIVYHERLGDVARCLPLARFFAQQGRRVSIECKREYHDLFALVSYARPVSPGARRADDAEIIPLQIWPARFADFEASGLNWMDYVYAPWPDCPREIVFDREPPACVLPEWVSDSCLAFPNGYSQRNAPDPRWVVLTAHQLFPGVPVCVIGKSELGCYELQSIPQLIAWIRTARHVLTVNTAPSILASAVRSEWHHAPDLDPRHDWQHPRRVVVPRPL